MNAYSAALAADLGAFEGAPPAAPLTALARIYLTYGWRHRRLPQLADPVRFTDLVQWRKLFDHDPRQPRLADKVAAKAYARRLLGEGWITPTLWHGDVLPERPEWTGPFVVKSRHGCNQTRFVRGGAEDWDDIRRAAAGWITTRYGYWLDEWLYREIPRGILVEPFIGDGGALPVDYKLYVFGGRVTHIQVHLDREHDHRWMLFTPDWRRRSAPSADTDPPRPRSLDAMIAAAETLGQGFDFVRTDFYEVGGRPLFGEMTFYPGSGLDPFDPDDLDLELGALWRAARDFAPPAPAPSPSAIWHGLLEGLTGDQAVTRSV
ncbi:ATP-grasp fold amidoligase family protein [Flavisphingopyxis soli]|uniref:ATP-grasp fold amidoligase family protein n=1 Tax=Flavisphingopyxis soli TaxID=2601267 RepID=UPI001F33EBA5|nr:ATP-grasp fold amidoligase family protein [Sphingorhabdus soli]